MKRMKYWIMHGYEMRLVWPTTAKNKAHFERRVGAFLFEWSHSENHNHLNRVWCSVPSNCAVW